MTGIREEIKELSLTQFGEGHIQTAPTFAHRPIWPDAAQAAIRRIGALQKLLNLKDPPNIYYAVWISRCCQHGRKG